MTTALTPAEGQGTALLHGGGLFGQPLIQPERVARDSRGFWRHPMMPDPFPDHQAFELWYSHHRIESRIVLMTGEPEQPPTTVVLADTATEHCADWEPTAPQGEGWFLLCIGLSDSDGPAAWWVRRRSPASDVATEARRHQDL